MTEDCEVFVVKAKDDIFPLDYKLISKGQKTCKELKFLGKKKPDTIRDTKFGKLMLAELSSGCKEDWAVYVPTELKVNMVYWYHEMLKHPGHSRLYATIRQWYNLPRRKKETEQFLKTCKECQENKITTSKKNRKVPSKDYKDPDPFDIVHLDSVGTWTIRVNIGNKIIR
eukprot:15215763-Ditylum_brightwellii.AAC.1